jgi:CBS domain-containing protein
MKIKEVMTKSADIIDPSASIIEAAKLMAKNNYGFLPVCDGQKIIGVITDRDIVVNGIAKAINPEEAIVKDIMTGKVLYCYENDAVQEVASLMEEEQVRRLIVLDDNKKIVGVVSLGDIVTKQDQQEINSNLIKAVSEE